MDTMQIARALDAAGNPTRLKVLCLLAGEPDGLAAGQIALRLDVVQNTLSGHLKILALADLVQVTRAGKSLTYSLDRAKVETMITSLSEALRC